ncbi:hypothetical protein T484DRAFT_1803900, partial [Baffinella frigidus]
ALFPEAAARVHQQALQRAPSRRRGKPQAAARVHQQALPRAPSRRRGKPQAASQTTLGGHADSRAQALFCQGSIRFLGRQVPFARLLSAALQTLQRKALEYYPKP